MSIADLADVAADHSIEVPFLKGAFAIGSTAVPYFSTALPAGQLQSMLRLPSQLPVDADQPIKLEELFQRELDESRVTERIMPYLRNDGRLRFFNALTVALLPLDPDDPRRLASTYPDRDDLAPPAHPGWERTAVGPITISHPPGNRDIGELRWHNRLTLPVILDGQHRFRAIEKLLADSAGQLFTDLAAVRVSILFLILDERAGFRAAEPASVLASCRDIFVDLNMHAVTVPRARLALLNDQSPWSMSLRSIISSGVGLDPALPAERVYTTGRLPLTLINWRGGDAKFDSGSYVTSLLTLQDMVEHVLGAARFRDVEYDRARDTMNRIAVRLDIEQTETFSLADVQRAIDDAERDERPFELTRKQAEAVGVAFASRLGQRITRPLVRLTPYATLSDKLVAAGLIGTELEPWLSFNDVERKTLLEQLRADDPAGEVSRIAQEVKGGPFRLAFQVVFQKAFVYSANSMVGATASLAEHWELEIPEGQEAEGVVLDTWIERFNSYVVPALGAERTASPFVGAGLRAGGDIDFRKTRIRTITGFVSYLLLAPMPEWVEARREGQLDEEEISNWVSEKWELILPGPRPQLEGLFSLHGKNWRNGIDEVVQGGAVVDEEIDVTDPDVRAAERLRFAALQLRRAVELAA
jgi:DNA-sulfur modification-associated